MLRQESAVGRLLQPVVVFTCLVGIIAGCSRDDDGLSKQTDSPRITGATDKEAELLRDLVRGLPEPQLREIRYFSTSERSRDGGRSLWLAFVAPPSSRLWPRASWEGLLIAGAMHKYVNQHDDVRPITGIAFRQLTKAGTEKGHGAFPIGSLSEPKFEYASKANAERVIRMNAKIRKYTVTAVMFASAPGPAPVIELSVASTEEFRAQAPYEPNDLLGSLMESDRPQLEGFYFEVRLRDRILYATGYARRLDTGSAWVDPRIAAVSASPRR